MGAYPPPSIEWSLNKSRHAFPISVTLGCQIDPGAEFHLERHHALCIRNLRFRLKFPTLMVTRIFNKQLVSHGNFSSGVRCGGYVQDPLRPSSCFSLLACVRTIASFTLGTLRQAWQTGAQHPACPGPSSEKWPLKMSRECSCNCCNSGSLLVFAVLGNFTEFLVVYRCVLHCMELIIKAFEVFQVPNLLVM